MMNMALRKDKGEGGLCRDTIAPIRLSERNMLTNREEQAIFYRVLKESSS